MCYPYILASLVISFLVLELFKQKAVPHPLVPVVLKETSSIDMGYFLFLSTIIGPIAEEIFFRGILYPLLKKRVGIIIAAIVSSLFFSTMHMNLGLFLGVFVLGLLFTYLYEKTGSILPGMFVHVMHNALMMALVMLIKKLI